MSIKINRVILGAIFPFFICSVFADEESSIDREVSKKHPLIKNVPLRELIKDFAKLPRSLRPSKVKVNLATDYESTVQGSSTGKRTESIGHWAVVQKVDGENLILTLPEASGFQAQVAMSATDFEKRVDALYLASIKRSNLNIEAKRVAMKKSLLAELARKAPTADPKKYGRGLPGSYVPVIRNGLGQKRDHEIPLGPIAGKALVLYGGKEATISELWNKGPGARAGLKVGDRILKLNGKSFEEYSAKSGDSPQGFPEALGLGILASQHSKTPLAFTLERDGEKQEINVPLPGLPNFSDTFPVDCPRSDFHIKIAADYLAKKQQKDGSWQYLNYSSAWCALALLATGDEAYAGTIKRTAKKFIAGYQMGSDLSHEDLIKQRGSLDNWHHAMVGIFLAEYYLATGDESVLETVNLCCRMLEARLQPRTGRLGHQGIKLAYGGYGLVLMNTQAHILWGLTARIYGMEWDWEPWKLSMVAVKDSIKTPGAIGYSKKSRGQVQSATRSGSMGTGLVLAERDSKLQREIGKWLYANRRTFPNTHAMTSLGIAYGFMGMKNTNPKKLPDCYQDYRWMYGLTTPPNVKEGAYYYGCRDNHVGDKNIKYDLVANWLTIMTLCAHRNDTLWSFGNRTQNWFK